MEINALTIKKYADANKTRSLMLAMARFVPYTTRGVEVPTPRHNKNGTMYLQVIHFKLVDAEKVFNERKDSYHPQARRLAKECLSLFKQIRKDKSYIQGKNNGYN